MTTEKTVTITVSTKDGELSSLRNALLIAKETYERRVRGNPSILASLQDYEVKADLEVITRLLDSL